MPGCAPNNLDGAYLILRGQYAEAVNVLDFELEPLSTIGWGRTRGCLARALNGVGQHARAREVCVDALSRLDPEDLAYPLMNGGLSIELALADAHLGEHAAARVRLDEQIALHADSQGPLVAGALFEARASVSLLEGNHDACAHFVEQMETAYQTTKISSPEVLRVIAERLANAEASDPGDKF